MARRLANWLRSYSEFTHNSEAPDVFNFWTGVSTIAGVLRRNVYQDEIKFKWYPNFYIIFVAPPGVVAKSTTINVGMRLLREIPGIVMGPSSMTWQGLTHALSESVSLVPTAYDPTGIVTEYTPMSAITCEVGELGTFFDARDDAMSSVLIDLWDGKDTPWERWLKTSENTKIENPWVNIIAATTPSWLRDNFGEGMIGGGLTSRVIFVYAESKKKLIPWISRVTDRQENEKLREDLVHDLEEMSALRGSFTITEEAYDWGSEWYRKLWEDPEEHLKGPRFEGYRARKQTHLVKLSMILSVAENDDLVITKDHFELADMLLTGVEHDMYKVFDSIGASTTSKHMNELVNFIKQRGRVTRQELWRHCIKFMGAKEFQEASESAIVAGYIGIKAQEGNHYYIFLGGDMSTLKED